MCQPGAASPPVRRVGHAGVQRHARGVLPIASLDLGGTPDASRPVPADGRVYIGTRHTDGTTAIDEATISRFATVGSSIGGAN